ncbi:MAG: alpha/beta fold hydrolase, partial [Pseudomonadota bacterium]
MLTKSKFRPAWWLRNPHLQTLWAAKVHPAPTPPVTYERLTTPDDDFIDLCWSADASGPLVIMFHGLTGSFKSRYVRALMATLQTQSIGSVLMHFRGCSGEPNKTAGAYHSGHTVDIEHVINSMHQRFPQRPLIAVGFSLGANALLKYLATTPGPLQYAIAVCPPLVLAEGAGRINRGFSKLYQRTLIKQMRHAMQTKHQRYPHLQLDKYNFHLHQNFFDW